MDQRRAQLEMFRDSLERCLADPTFTQRFYARFLLSHDEVERKFAHVDLKRQGKVLRASLYMVLRAALGHADGVEHLEELARTHSKLRHDVGPHLYEHWLDCLIAAARETDTSFGEGLADAWRAGLRPAIDIMTRRYESGAP